jgi:hypothetical protein
MINLHQKTLKALALKRTYRTEFACLYGFQEIAALCRAGFNPPNPRFSMSAAG